LPKINPHPIVQRILEITDKRGKTKTDLSVVIGSSPSLITKWKNAGYMPSVEYIPKICKYLNVSTDYILSGTGSDMEFSNFENPHLSQDENELIVAYRQLSTSQKGEFLGRMKALTRIKQK
jgi:transcriptional regulator with XRE-family HTH domain